MKKALILFVKFPKKGFVKTRLAKIIGDDAAVDLYRCFVSDILQRLRLSGIPLYIFFTGSDRCHAASWLGNNLTVVEQEGVDLGMRMAHAFQHVFHQADSAVIVGSDCPDLPLEIIHQAFDSLKTSDMAIGPSVDGGYYLLGLNKQSFSPFLFQNIAWSTGEVFAATLMKANKLTYKTTVLPEWEDIDDYASLQRFFQRNSASEGCLSAMSMRQRITAAQSIY